MVVAEHTLKVGSLETKVNATKKERFVWTKIYFVLGKNGTYNLNDLGSRLIAVVR